ARWVSLESSPAVVARRGLFPQGMPVLSAALLVGSPATGTLEQARAAIGKGAGITRMMQDARAHSARQRCPPHLTVLGPLYRTGWEREAVLGEIPHHPDRGADLPEGFEQQLDRFLHALIRVSAEEH